MKTIRPAQAEGAFATFGLCEALLRAISEAGFRQPRPIQSRTIPQVLRGRDVMGLAQTGTGKTAAFALPIIERLLASRGRNPRALILAPTRELALQIHTEIELLARYTNVGCRSAGVAFVLVVGRTILIREMGRPEAPFPLLCAPG